MGKEFGNGIAALWWVSLFLCAGLTILTWELLKWLCQHVHIWWR